MKRHTQVILYHLLPIVFWLLAIGGSLVPFLFWFHADGTIQYNYHFGFIVAAIVLVCVAILAHVKRHASAVMPCWHVAILLSVASYWLPSVVILILPMWIYLGYRHVMDVRAFVATLLGLAFVAIWAAVAVFMEWIDCPWADFLAKENAFRWIPVGAFLIAWIASTIARQNLRVR